jgi:hypothetical protein
MRLRDVRDVFDLSASANLVTPLAPILLAVWSENETNLQYVTAEIE